MSHYLLRSAGGLLAITGVLKGIMLFGGDEVLTINDPIFGLPVRVVIFLAAVAEVAIGVLVVRRPTGPTPLLLMAILTALIAAYRFGLYYLDYHKPCTCLGQLTSMLGLSESTADKISLSILAFTSLAVGIGFYTQNARRDFVNGPR
jgi:hypothetical protein